MATRQAQWHTRIGLHDRAPWNDEKYYFRSTISIQFG
jgi:hypothetical protein